MMTKRNFDLERGATEEDVRHAYSPPFSSFAVISAILAYSCIFTFAVDQSSFGWIQVQEQFQEAMCVKNDMGNLTTCGLDWVACDHIVDGHSHEPYMGIAGGTCNDGQSGLQCCNTILNDNDTWQDLVIVLFPVYLLLGGIVSSLTIAPFLNNKYGRVICIRWGSLPIVIGALLQSYLGFEKYWVIALGRTILGMGCGMQIFSAPLYGAEISNAKYRARVTGLFQVITVAFGAAVAVIPVFLSSNFKGYKLFFLLPMILQPISFFGTYYMARSPRWMMDKHGYERGYEILKTLRDVDPEREARAIWESIEADRAAPAVTYVEAISKPNLRIRTMVVIVINMAQQFTGVNVLINMSGNIWTQAIGPGSQWSGLVQQGTFLPFVIIGYLALDSKWGGRRIQYLVGTTIMAIGSIMIMVGTHTNQHMVQFIGSLVVFGIGFQISHGLIAWLYPAEAFTTNEKKTVAAFGMVSQWVANIIMNYASPWFNNHWFTAGAIFLAADIVFIVFVWFYFEETKGVALEDITELYKDTPHNHWPLKKKTRLEDMAGMKSSIRKRASRISDVVQTVGRAPPVTGVNPIPLVEQQL